LVKFDANFITFYSAKVTPFFLAAICVFKNDRKFLLETLATSRILNEINFISSTCDNSLNKTRSVSVLRIGIDCSTLNTNSFLYNTLYSSTLSINCLSHLPLSKLQLSNILIPLKSFFEVTDSYFDTAYNSFNSQKVIALPSNSKALRSFLHILAYILNLNKLTLPHKGPILLGQNNNNFIFDLFSLVTFLDLNKMYTKKFFFKQDYKVSKNCKFFKILIFYDSTKLY